MPALRPTKDSLQESISLEGTRKNRRDSFEKDIDTEWWPSEEHQQKQNSWHLPGVLLLLEPASRLLTYTI